MAFFGLLALGLPLSAAAAPTAKSGDGTLSVSPATVAAASAGNRLEFQFRNQNRGAYNVGSQLELSVPAGWSVPQTADPAAPGYVDVFSTAGTAVAAVSSISGSGPWQVTVDFTAAKGTANGFGLAYAAAAPSATGTHSFAARTRQAGGTFVELGASPVVEVVPAPALVALDDLIQDYDGTPRAVTVATDPAGLAVAVTYDGAPAAPVATGIYAVVATVVEPGYEGSATGLLVVREAGGGEPAVGLETFENFAPAGSDYESGAFLGQDGSVWTYAQARGDLSIAGRSPTLEKAKGAFIRSGAIPGGVGTVSLKYRKAGTQNVACGVFVNDVQIGTISGGDGSVQTWTSGPIDVCGDVVLVLTNNVNAGAITLDDVEWTGCKLPATVTLADLAQTYDGTPRPVAAPTEPEGLAVEITYDGSATAPTAAGTYAVVATVVDDDYAGTASGTLTVAKADQNIDFAVLAAPAEFQTLPLGAVASSGLPVSFAVSFGPAAIAADGASVSFSGTGRVAIAASQAGDGNWNAAPSVAREFDVLPAFALSAESVNVREDGEGRLFVRLNGAPAATMTVTVARVGGDVDLRVKSGAALAFGPANWNWWQTVTLAAADDEDKVGGTATFRVSLPGYEPRMVAAKELDGDVAMNLAAATNGATISGGANADQLIDGVHKTFFNYGCLVWTNEPVPAMTLALKAPSAVSRIRVLNWNWLYPVLHRYRIEGSADGTNWTTLVDAGGSDRQGWDEWELPEQPLSHLRFVGLSNSANQLVCIAEWEVFGKRIPKPAEITLGNLRQVYDGQPKAVDVETDPPALPVAVAYEDAPVLRRSEPVLATETDLPVAAGTYLVQAEVDDEDYDGYAEDVLVIEKAAQTLSFPNPGFQSRLDRPYLQAAASSGLPVSYAVVAGPAALDDAGIRLSFTGTGTVTVVASQAGDANWNPAEDVAVSFDVGCAGLVVQLSQTNVNVREGGEGRLFVRLGMAPTANVAVTVSRIGGSTNVAVASGADLTFKPSNWDVWQPVTLIAGEDDDAIDETAEFRIAGLCPTGRIVTVTVLDDDLGENLALATGGATISGTRGYRLADAIDGMHAVMTNYAFTTWASVPPGTIQLDLQATAAVARVRILTWDWTYRDHRYTIEGSADGVAWTLLADASAEARRGWDDWPGAAEPVRYLRFTGLENSVNSAVCVPEWEVYGTRPALPALETSKTNVLVREGGEGRFFVRLAQEPASNVVARVERIAGDASLEIQDGASLTFKPSNWSVWQRVTLAQAADANAAAETATFRVSAPGMASLDVAVAALEGDVGENLALASGGATLTGFRAYFLPYVIDGEHAVSSQYGYTVWTNAKPGTMTLDLGGLLDVTHVRLLNWDWSFRSHNYVLESSADGATWTLLADASAGRHQGWEEWPTAGGAVRYLRFTGMSNTANSAVCLAELEVWGTRSAARRRLAPSPSTASAAEEPMDAAGSAGAAFLESIPVTVLTSDGPADETGWNAVDGDDATAWVGQKHGGGYVVVEYQPTLTLAGLDVDVSGTSLADAQILTSLDARNWQPLPADLEAHPVELNFLWVIFPDDGTDAVPEVLEIRPNP
jgi:hypothetical protein